MRLNKKWRINHKKIETTNQLLVCTDTEVDSDTEIEALFYFDKLAAEEVQLENYWKQREDNRDAMELNRLQYSIT